MAFGRGDHVHLMEILEYRSVQAAAVSIGLTRRCPLHCRHCSTESLMDSEEFPAGMFTRFADTFTADSHPDFVLLSGGEALLRPALVRAVAERSRAVGARTHLLSGLFFPRRPRIPTAVRKAIEAVDHFSASLDVFHEEEVSRPAVFRVLHELLDAGKDVSLQLVGLGPDDPYLADITGAVRREFDDQVPMLVVPLASVGRAREWFVNHPGMPQPVTAEPCSLAGWPVVGFNGQVTACGNQDVMDGKVPLPAHLYLGHIARDDWATIRRRSLESPMVRALRTFGPRYLADRVGAGCGDAGYCETCYTLSKSPDIRPGVREMVRRPSTAVVEQLVTRSLADAGALSFARHFAVEGYADLVALGHRTGQEGLACTG